MQGNDKNPPGRLSKPKALGRCTSVGHLRPPNISSQIYYLRHTKATTLPLNSCFFPRAFFCFFLTISLINMSSPITCHVLNTLSGTPANGLKATLTLLATKSASGQGGESFTAITNEDGRVKEWEASSGKTLLETMEQFAAGERIPWSIKFDIGPWYEERQVESFWPEIEVKFYIKKGERHYHVPVLVGPWTYTTYRGS